MNIYFGSIDVPRPSKLTIMIESETAFCPSNGFIASYYLFTFCKLANLLIYTCTIKLIYACF